MSETLAENHKRNYGDCLERESRHLEELSSLLGERSKLMRELKEQHAAASTFAEKMCAVIAERDRMREALLVCKLGNEGLLIEDEEWWTALIDKALGETR